MSKVESIKELVEWTTSNDSNVNFCVGKFSKDANKPFILKELINAPIDRESMSSRIYKNKHKDNKDYLNPISIGYSEDYIKIYTDKVLDDYDFRDARLPYSFVESGEEKVKNESKNFYVFQVNVKDGDF